MIVPRIDRGYDRMLAFSLMGAAKAVSVVTPTTGLFAASAMPRAAEGRRAIR
jgi:hypothetical protein